MSITLDDQISELMRELAVRESVYAKLVRDGKMPQAKADLQLARLQAALETVERVKRLDVKLQEAMEPKTVQ